jgi:hypothetical protein
MKTQVLMLMSISLLCAGCQLSPMAKDEPRSAPSSAPACKGPGGPNNRDDCTIFVVVKESGSTCTVDALPSQQTVVFDLGYADRWILWRFDTNSAPGYQFTRLPKPEGIEFKNDPLQNFKPCNATGGGDGYQCNNRNRKRSGFGDYAYAIRVENPTKGIACKIDPLIRNQ